MKIQTLIYDKHRRCILLHKQFEDSLYRLPFILTERYRDTQFDYESDFKELLQKFLKKEFSIIAVYERPILFVYDRDENDFVLTMTMKETKHNSDYEWFDLNNLPDFNVIEDMAKIALRAEMKEVTYDIPEYTRA